MTSIAQARREALRGRIEEVLQAALSCRHPRQPLSAIRAAISQLAAGYKEFVVWGPEISRGRMIVVIWEWKDGVRSETLAAAAASPEWCDWEQGKEKPPTL